MVTLQIRGFIYCTLNQISKPVVLFTIFNFNSRICRAFLLVHSFFFFSEAALRLRLAQIEEHTTTKAQAESHLTNFMLTTFLCNSIDELC